MSYLTLKLNCLWGDSCSILKLFSYCRDRTWPIRVPQEFKVVPILNRRMLSSGSWRTIVCTGNEDGHLIFHGSLRLGCCNSVEMMECDVGTAYAVETPFYCQVQRLVGCIFEFLRNGCFAKGGSGDEYYQNLMARMTDRSDSLNFSGSFERRTIDELWEVLRKAHVDAYEDAMASRLEESTPSVFCLIAASDVDKLLPLYRSLQEHLRSDIDEDMSDAASPNAMQSSGDSSVMELSDEDDTSMLDEDEDEDQAVTQQDSGSESDQHMDCDSSGIHERPASEDQCLESELAHMQMCDAEP